MKRHKNTLKKDKLILVDTQRNTEETLDQPHACNINYEGTKNNYIPRVVRSFLLLALLGRRKMQMHVFSVQFTKQLK